METRHHRGSILMMPWLAQGHVLPYFELAKTLSRQNFNIYLCSTPINLKPIREQLSQCHSKFSFSIQLVYLHLPCSFPELPPHLHTTKDLPPHLLSTLFIAFDSAKPEFCNILKTLKPDLVIYDFFQPWAPQAAQELNIEATLFLTCGAASLCFLLHYSNDESMQFPFPELSLPETECQKVNQFIHGTANGIINKDRYLECISRSSKFILIKSSRNIEAKYIDHLSLLAGKQMVPVGLLVREPEEIDNDKTIIDWLRKKEPSSVVFVSFGSEYLLTMEEITEIAHGLELSEVCFIWVVRIQDGDKITIHEALPEGFLERMGERGMIVEGWAPQTKILEHSSIGGFVSHCGWGSTIESIMFGVPILAMAMLVDQPLNAKLLVDIGVGREVKRENEKLNREEVARVIREVVLQEEGKQIRRKAKELSSRLRKKVDEQMDVVTGKLLQLVKESGTSAATASTDP